MFSLGNKNFNARKVGGRAMFLHRCPHGVLEKLVQDVIQVGWRITECKGSFLALFILDQSLALKYI